MVVSVVVCFSDVSLIRLQREHILIALVWTILQLQFPIHSFLFCSFSLSLHFTNYCDRDSSTNVFFLLLLSITWTECSWNKQTNPWQKFLIIHHNTYTKIFNQFSIQCDINVCTLTHYLSISISKFASLFFSFTSYFALTQYIDSLYAHTQVNLKKHTIRCDDGCTTESHSEKFDLFSQSNFVCMLRLISMCVRFFFIVEHGCYCGCLWAVGSHNRMFGVFVWVCVFLCVYMLLWRWRSPTLTAQMSNRGWLLFTSSDWTKNIAYLLIFQSIRHLLRSRNAHISSF